VLTSYLLVSTLHPSHRCQPFPLGKTLSAILLTNFVKEKINEKHEISATYI
jgi:hypothetical protein